VSEKVSRKELLKQEDAFLHAANQGAAWLKGHRNLVIVTVATVLALVLGIWGSIELSEGRRLKASMAFTHALELKDAQIAADPTKADPTGTPPTFASAEERRKAILEAFQKAVDSGKGPGQLARFYIGELEAEGNETDKAIATYKKLLDDLDPNDSLYFLAVERYAYAVEAKGDIPAAMAAWERLTGSNKRFYADQALFQLARLNVDKGENDKARDLLVRLEKDFPESAVMQKVQQLYARVGRPEPKPEGAGDKAATGTP
jgi:tetratricopeptide (TPR) repeat protein